MQFAVKNKTKTLRLTLSLFFIKHRAMKTYGAMEVFLTSALDRDQSSASRFCRFTHNPQVTNSLASVCTVKTESFILKSHL
jgi:hypothetical protein